MRSLALNQESPALYYPLAARVWPLMDVVVRAPGPTQNLLPSIRRKVRELDPELALANVRTMDPWIAVNSAQLRLSTQLLAALGICGVLASSVSQRTREIGMRMALGAQRGGVLRLVVGEGMRVASAGIGLGLLGGVALGRAGCRASSTASRCATRPRSPAWPCRWQRSRSRLAPYRPCAPPGDPMAALRCA